MSTREPEAPLDVQQRIQHDLDLCRQSVAVYKERLKEKIVKLMEVDRARVQLNPKLETALSEQHFAYGIALCLIDQTV